MHSASFMMFVAEIGLPARLGILGIQAWILYWWFKRQRRLDALGNAIRVVAITAGVGLMLLTAHLDHHRNELQVMRFVVLPASMLIVVFLFFPDAAYFVAQALRKVFHREPSKQKMP